MAPPAQTHAAVWRRVMYSFVFGDESIRLKWLRLLLLLVVFKIASAKWIIETLPGYSGTLPFKLETGYVSVGETNDVQLFYYFIESERNPAKDPIMLWLTGGPGCSAFSGLVYEIGPLAFDVPAFSGSLPTFILNPYSWTKVANIIFLDEPVGTGFSYATTSKGYHSSDTKSAKDVYDFLKKWLLDHPQFSKNPLYVGGDSYSGIIVPMVVLEISNGNDAGYMPRMSLQGYLLGNPGTNEYKDNNSRVPFAHGMALIPNEYYEAAKSICHGEYVNPDPKNALCIYYLLLIEECTTNVNEAHILEPKCAFRAPKPDEFKLKPRYSEEIPLDVIILPSQQDELWCRTDSYVLSYIWANDPTVQDALHIRNATKSHWLRCNKSLSYDSDVPNVVEYHRILSKKVNQALIYSGDHDMIVPYIGTREWIRYLNLPVEAKWRPWFVDGQVAGYTEVYKDNGFYLTFATVKGAGHTAPEYKPKQCLAMVKRWFAHYGL